MSERLTHDQLETLKSIINVVYQEYSGAIQSHWQPRRLSMPATLTLENEYAPSPITMETNLYVLLCGVINSRDEEQDFELGYLLDHLEGSALTLMQHEFHELSDSMRFITETFAGLQPTFDIESTDSELYEEMADLFARYVSVNVIYNELEQTDPDLVPDLTAIKEHCESSVLALVRQLQDGLPVEGELEDPVPAIALSMVTEPSPFDFGFASKGFTRFERPLLGDGNGFMGTLPKNKIPVAELTHGKGRKMHMSVKSPSQPEQVCFEFQSLTEALLASGNTQFGMAVLQMLAGKMPMEAGNELLTQTPVELSPSLAEAFADHDLGAGDVINIITKTFGAELLD
ncbi:hypothetical protein AWH63_10880 [Marinobacter sp. C18]|uniref:hypothetical protein n=1 Tax=Marinobacter sp. C18 TaxID=1772288 RepID=UPI000948B362|nr:hypothetical protein [Marinobacter sp. C18]OLF82035.1 hypothetical protein AWH63_10880 [Marinobacter sp. C18]